MYLHHSHLTSSTPLQHVSCAVPLAISRLHRHLCGTSVLLATSSSYRKRPIAYYYLILYCPASHASPWRAQWQLAISNRVGFILRCLVLITGEPRPGFFLPSQTSLTIVLLFGHCCFSGLIGLDNGLVLLNFLPVLCIVYLRLPSEFVKPSACIFVFWSSPYRLPDVCSANPDFYGTKAALQTIVVGILCPRVSLITPSQPSGRVVKTKSAKLAGQRLQGELHWHQSQASPCTYIRSNTTDIHSSTRTGIHLVSDAGPASCGILETPFW